MNHMDPRTVIRVSGVNRLLRSVLLATSVDRSYWMRALSRLVAISFRLIHSVKHTGASKYWDEKLRKGTSPASSFLLFFFGNSGIAVDGSREEEGRVVISDRK